MSTSFITPGHVRAFQAVTTQLYGEVTPASCRINGEAGVAIVLMEHVGEGSQGLMPANNVQQTVANRRTLRYPPKARAALSVCGCSTELNNIPRVVHQNNGRRMDDTVINP
jgi:hypothetical protein